MIDESLGQLERFIEWARSREIIVVAGANQAFKYGRRILLGRGTRDRPFEATQSIEAAIALLDLTGTDRRSLFAWGYGPVVDPARLYFYRGFNGRIYEIRFLARDGIGNAYNYTYASARSDACRLGSCVSRNELVASRPVMFVGCSWGAAVIDQGLTQTPADRRLPGPGVAVGGPSHLPAPSWPRPLASRALSPNGDHGHLWVQRHPADPIGRGGLAPLLYFRNKRLHDYRIAGRGSGSGMWGISGDPAGAGASQTS